ncbi:MAG: immunoglobulin domain-containing protein [Phycisphaerales bacterium]|nr:immunoglobulin domain-containing protein [Phycisphaerales bacterium]
MIRTTAAVLVSLCASCLPAEAGITAQPRSLELRPTTVESSGRFGRDVVLTDDYIVVVQAAGPTTGDKIIYVYDRQFAGVRNFQMPHSGAFQSASDAEPVAVQGDTLVFGTKPSFSAPGQVHICNIVTGAVTTITRGNQPGQNNFFGEAVAIAGDMVVVGDSGANSFFGSVSVFDLAGNFVRELVPENPDLIFPQLQFGRHVEADGNLVLVSAPNESNLGVSRVFDVTTGAEIRSILPQADPGDPIALGFQSSSMDAGRVALGDNQGRVWVYDIATGDQLFVADGFFPYDLHGDIIAVTRGSQIDLIDITNGAVIGSLADAVQDSVARVNSVDMDDDILVYGDWRFGEFGFFQSGRALVFDLGPAISLQPVSQAANPGEPVQLTSAIGVPLDVTYQWRRDGVDVVDGNGVSGATTGTLGFTASPATEGVYDCVATNSRGSAVSEQAFIVVREDPNACTADLNGDGLLNFFDVSVFLTAYGAGCP